MGQLTGTVGRLIRLEESSWDLGFGDLGIGLPSGFDVGGFFVAFVEDEAVVKFGGGVGLDGVGTVGFFGVEALEAEGVGGKEAVGAAVPVGGEAEAGGVV